MEKALTKNDDGCSLSLSTTKTNSNPAIRSQEHKDDNDNAETCGRRRLVRRVVVMVNQSAETFFVALNEESRRIALSRKLSNLQ